MSSKRNIRRALIITLAVVAAAAAAPRGVSAAPGDLLDEIYNPEPHPGDNFGAALAADYLVHIGTPNDDATGSKNGSVYWFDPTVPDTIVRLDNPDAGTHGRFGAAAAVDDQYAYGAPGYDHDSGALYVFQDDTLLLTLDNPNNHPGDAFGSSIAWLNNGSDSELIAVGAPGTDFVVTDSHHSHYTVGNAGAVYVFNGDDESGTDFGSLLLSIHDPSLEPHDGFGTSVAWVADYYLLVGAPGDSTTAPHGGTAYLFDADPTSPTFGDLILTINNPTPYSNERFGFAVAGLDEYPVVSAYRDTLVDSHGHPGHDVGTVYVFDSGLTGTTDTPDLIIDNPEPSRNPWFGYSLATLGYQIYIGAPRGTDGGAAYVFDGDQSGETDVPLLTLSNPEPQSHDNYGAAITAWEDSNGPWVAVGAPQHDVTIHGTSSHYHSSHDQHIHAAGAVSLFEGISQFTF